MAKSFPNIDKSSFRRGEYVGYSVGGKVWKITKANPNGSRAKWLAQAGRQFLTILPLLLIVKRPTTGA
jgi:hypothetical protein